MIQAFERLSLTSTQYYSQISTNQFSQKLIDKARFAKIDSMLIYNFKSFKEKVYVGPFLQFTSIIGPNGAGKSNILDAMMFCFCNEQNKLQFYDIRQFINRQGKQSYKEMSSKNKHCYVEVAFLLEDKSRFTLRRTLYANENQVFMIDGQEYSQKVYENYLMKTNINYISSNYAIWQGQIDKILLKSPKELTSYIETISGSLFFKNDQEKIQKLLIQVEKNLQLTAQKLLVLKLQKKKIKKNQKHKSSSLALQKQYEQILIKILLIKVYFSNKQIKQFQKQIAIKQKEQKQKIKQINQIKLQLQEQQNNKRGIQQSRDAAMRQIAELNAQLRNIDNNTSIIELQTLKQLQNNIQNLRKYRDGLQERLSEKQKQNQELQSVDINKEYLQLYSQWQNDNEAINKDLSKKKQQYLYIEGLIQSKKVIIQQYQQKKHKNQQSHELSQKIKKQLSQNIEQIQQNIAKLKIQKSKTMQDCQKNKLKMQELSKEINDYNQKIIELDSIINDSIQNDKDKDLVHKLKAIEGFKGIVQQWVKPTHKKYQVCFQIMMGKILKFLLCLDEGASKHIAIKLRQYGQIRNVVILNNIPQTKRDQNKNQLVRNDIGKLGCLAIEALQYDKNIHNFQLFLKDFLGNKVICQNLSKAWQILGKNIKGIKQIYTLDGNILSTDGTVSSYGSVESVKTKYKYLDISKNKSTIMQSIQKHQKDKKKLQDDLDLLRRKFGDESMQRNSAQLQKLQSRKQQLSQKLSFLKQNAAKKQLKVPRGLQDELEELKTRQFKLQTDIKDIQSKMIDNKIFKDFVKKNKISNFQSFRVVENLGSLESVMKIKNSLNRQRQQISDEIKKITTSLNQKEIKFQKLNQKVESIKTYDSKQTILKNLRAKQNLLINFKQILSKMSNINLQKLKFKSQVPSLRTKLTLMKEKSDRLLKNELHSLGLSDFPDDSHYNSLEEHLGTKIQRASKRNIQQAQETLQKQKLDLQHQLEQLTLQLSNNVQQNHEDIDKQIGEINKQVLQYQEEIKRLSQQLEVIKKNRKQLFMQFINDLKPILQETYAILTQNNDGIPGRADLYMQNQAFPCEDGIYYYPTPPNKRFVYDLDQLSGGQKSIASLALQYSIAITSKSIFLMLDEIDAFLDKINVNKFIKLIKNSMKYKSLQFILVTHKKSLFLNGQSLIGIAKPAADPFSKAYSLRLQDQEIYQEQSKASKASSK